MTHQINPKREDLRIRMTRKLILEAMIALMAQKKFDDIHISDVCEKAMIHRTTFYKHFEDKIHLLRFIIEDFHVRLEAELMASVPFENPAQYYCTMIRRFMPVLSANQRVCSLIIENDGNNVIISILHQLLIKDVISRLETYDVRMGKPGLVPAHIDAEFHVGGLEALIIWWLKNNRPCSEEEIIRYIDVMFQNTEGAYLQIFHRT